MGACEDIFLVQQPDNEIKKLADSRNVLSFGDASRAQGSDFDVVEVLAAVSEHSSDGGVKWPSQEVKYGYFENLLRRTKENLVEIEKWRRAIFQSTVYVYDPRRVSRLIRESDEYEIARKLWGLERADRWALSWLGEETMRIMPAVWLPSMDVQSESTLWAIGTIQDLYLALDWIHASVRGKFVNLRRNVLQNQHMFEAVLDKRPSISMFDTDSKSSDWTVEVHDLVVSIVPPIILDAGHGGMDLPILDASRVRQRQRLTTFDAYRPLPAHIPGRVSTLHSHLDKRLQIADVAAGYARHLYEKHGENVLIDHFDRVYVNGRRVKGEPIASRIRLTRATSFELYADVQ